MPMPSGAVLVYTLATLLSTALLILQYYRTSTGHFDFGGGVRGTGSPILGEYVDNEQKPMWGGSKPWALRTCHSHTNDVPDTGVTRHYNFSLGYGKFSPDGFEKEMMVVNNQFPGPVIEANWGDWIEVVVENSLREGSALHWHGILQQETPWADGVPGVTQCPIAPGQKLTYRFRASNYGTSWWHSHHSAQYSMGLLGPVIIHGPKHYKYDTDLGPVFLNDWYHREYHDIINSVWGTNPEKIVPNIYPDNILINGKNNFNCSFAKPGQNCVPNAELSKFYFQRGKTHVLRLINSGAGGKLYFSIDEHEVTVVAIDFEPVNPYTANGVMLDVGQRMDVLVHGSGKSSGAYHIRTRNRRAQGCKVDELDPPSKFALAVIYYEGASPSDPAIPTFVDSTPWPLGDHCGDDPLEFTTPYRVEPAVEEDVLTVELEMKVGVNGSGIFFLFVNDSSFKTNFSDPVLRDVARGDREFPESYNLFDTGNAKVVRFVIVNNMDGSHPMHMHGHTFQTLSHTLGLTWDGNIINPSNPLRRDTVVVAAFSTIVLQIEANNPGVWPLHCHVTWHVSAGLALQFVEQKDELRSMLNGNESVERIEAMVERSCGAWGSWVEKHGTGQIDSGWSLDG